MTAAEAKKAVLEKYPQAECVYFPKSPPYWKIRLYMPMTVPQTIGEGIDKDSAWLSAYERMKHEASYLLPDEHTSTMNRQHSAAEISESGESEKKILEYH